MAYIRFIWYRVRGEDGLRPLRWALNVSNPTITLEQYLADQNLTLVDGPFKTKKLASG